MPFYSHVSLIEKVMFTKHLSVMMKSGVSIYEALDTIASSTTNNFFQNILYGALKEVENGKSLSEALSRYPKVFDRFYTSLVRVSEDSGTLEETLHYLSQQLSKEYALKKKIQGAMFYPMFILVVTLIIGSFISVFILPQLVDFFNNLNVPLPLPTIILLNFASLMKNYGILIIAGLFGLLIFARFLISTSVIKPIWQSFLIRLPVIGSIIIYSQLTRFTRNLSILIKSGVPLATGLSTSADTLNIISFRKHAKYIEESLLKGKSISDTLFQQSFREFPAMAVKMIHIGEKTGSLESVLMYLSNFYEEEVDNNAKNLSNVIEPIMLIGIGLFVAFIAFAIITPIYEITGSLSQ
jgi:type IV pilus assembly protein PilC